MAQRRIRAAAWLVLCMLAGCTAAPPASSPTASSPATSVPAAPNTGVPNAAPTGTTTSVASAAPTTAATEANAADQPVRGGTLVFATSLGVTSINPFVANGSVTGFIKAAVYEPLLMYDESGQLQGMLAETWSSNDDATVWTFELRKGVKFHNGQEMTAQDVAWSANYVLDKENGAYGYGILSADVASVQAAGPYTVKFTMKGPRVLFPHAISNGNILNVAPADSIKAGETAMTTPPPGTGAFKFESWDPAGTYTVTRFDDYWAGAPYLDKIVFQLIAQETARGTALRAGDVQMAERIPIDLVQRIQKGEVTGITLSQARYSGYTVLAFNHKSRWFQDIRMRQAVSFALNQDETVAESFNGFGTPAEHPLIAGTDWANAISLPHVKQDVNRAKELLKEAGYNGEELTLLGSRGSRDAQVESISRQLRDVGINVVGQLLESKVYDERQQNGDFDMTMAGMAGSNEPGVDNQTQFRCEPGDSRNYNKLGYCNPALDALLDQYLAEPDRAKRVQIYAKVAQLLYDDFVAYHLGWHGDRFFAFADNVKGFTQVGDGTYFDAKGGLKRTWIQPR